MSLWSRREPPIELVDVADLSPRCVCGHPRNEHYPYCGYCSVSGCNCKQPEYRRLARDEAEAA